MAVFHWLSMLIFSIESSMKFLKSSVPDCLCVMKLSIISFSWVMIRLISSWIFAWIWCSELL